MPTRLRFPLMTLVLAFVALGGLPLAGSSPAYVNPTPGRDIALQIPGMHRAAVRRNLVYAPDLTMDVYRPRGVSRPLPALLFVHGSGGQKDAGVFVGWGDAYHAQSSPLTYLRASSLPVLVAKAGRDAAPINGSIDRFVAKGRRLGARVELLVHASGDHGFDASRPNARAAAIVRRTLAFVRAQLGR